MSAEYLVIHENNPDKNKINKVVDCLKNGGAIIFPTDSVYSFGCDITNLKAMEKLAKIKNTKINKANFSFVCYDISDINKYVKPLDSRTFKLLKRTLPGAYTFILETNNNLPKFYKGKKEVGVRIPDNNIPREIVETLKKPISATSVYDKNEIVEYTTDAQEIYDRYKNDVDLVIDGGYSSNIPSTVISTIGEEFEILREGAGDINIF